MSAELSGWSHVKQEAAANKKGEAVYSKFLDMSSATEGPKVIEMPTVQEKESEHSVWPPALLNIIQKERRKSCINSQFHFFGVVVVVQWSKFLVKNTFLALND